MRDLQLRIEAGVSWAMLLVMGFLAPGAVAVGAMLVAMSAGAADVLCMDMPQPVRTAAIFVATCLAGLLWSAPIVWMAEHAPASGALRMAFVIVVAVIAAGAPLAFARETVRSDEATGGVTAAICLSGAMTAAGVLAALWARV